MNKFMPKLHSAFYYDIENSLWEEFSKLEKGAVVNKSPEKNNPLVDEINQQQDPDSYVSNLLTNNNYGASKIAEKFSEIKFKNPDNMLLKVWENLSPADSVSRNNLTDCFIKRLEDQNRNNRDCIGKFLNNILKETYWYPRATILKNIGKICDKLDGNNEKDKNLVKLLIKDGLAQELNPFARKNLADNYDKIVRFTNDDTKLMNETLNFILNDDYEFMKKTLKERIKYLPKEQQEKIWKMIENKDPLENYFTTTWWADEIDIQNWASGDTPVGSDRADDWGKQFHTDDGKNPDSNNNSPKVNDDSSKRDTWGDEV